MSEQKRRSLREAARRGAEAGRRERESGVEEVVAKCGHAVPMPPRPDGEDRYRDARRRGIAGRDCPECRRKAHEERTRAQQEAARLRRQARPPAPPGHAERLPHGSRFDGLVWDAAKGEWTGTLTIPDAGPGGEPLTFTASATGVFKLLAALDRAYRASLAMPGP